MKMAVFTCVNKCFPEYVKSDLQWYERDGLDLLRPTEVQRI